MLHREALALAIRRIEESARTEADFENVLYWWDKLDANRERKERDHEIGRSTVPLEWGADKMYFSGRPSYDVVLRKLLFSGEFIDVIFDHLETIHELVTDVELSGILKDLKPHYKNMLYYLFLHDYSTTEYADSIGQSDRNIRGIRETALSLKKIRPLSSGTSIPCLSWCRCAFPSCSRIRTVICVCVNTVKKPLSQAGKEMNFAARDARTNIMSINQEIRKRGTKKMIENRNVNIITDADGKKLVLSTISGLRRKCGITGKL